MMALRRCVCSKWNYSSALGGFNEMQRDCIALALGEA
jgi:hypothetical protein